ncbi:MAG: hypothetical protein IMF14_08975 [Proteobacteria bacterium]|nr:hypothetical protein [Pseudomonadota bacterium]
MKIFIMLILLLPVITACNFKEGLKEAGDGVQEGVGNAGEALKGAPAEVSEASNKAEKDIKQ